MSNDGNTSSRALSELRAAARGPLRCGQTRLGAFRGIYWPKHFEGIAKATRERLPLDDESQQEIDASLSRFEAIFRKLASSLDPAQSQDVATMVAEVAFLMSFATPESINLLLDARNRQVAQAKEAPLGNAVEDALRALGAGASAKEIQKFVAEHGSPEPSKALISTHRKKFRTRLLNF